MTPSRPRPGDDEHRRCQGLLRRAAEERATPRELAELAKHLRHCESCREDFDRQVAIDRELSTLSGVEPIPELTPLERAIAASRIFALDERAPKTRWGWGWRLGLVAAAAALLLVALLVSRLVSSPPALDPRPPSQFAARGAGDLALRLFCVASPESKGKRFRPAVSSAGKVASCALGEHLKLAYLATHPKARYVWILSLDEKKQINWYYPLANATRGVTLKVGPSLRPLPGMIKLSINHRPGEVKVLAIFSAEAISGAEIRAAVKALREVPLAKISSLNLAAETVQLAQTLRIAP